MNTKARFVALGALLIAGALLAGVGARPARAQSFLATPLNDMGSQTYLGSFSGGLYFSGSDWLPVDHAAAGAAHVAQVQPLDTNGNPDPNGKIVLVSIGMSNTTQEFCSPQNPGACNSWTFMGQAAADPAVNQDTLVIINGAKGGQAAATWISPTDANYDRVRDTDLAPAGLTEAQVQAAWVKVADPDPTVSLPSSSADGYTLESYMGDIVRAMKVRYPNLRLVYLSSRIYAGYATTNLNPEPYAYESGFSVKWLIQAQIDQMRTGNVDPIAGDLDYRTVAPWIAWGPYLWADGTIPRSDGLVWLSSDFQSDGTHPSMSGQQKVGTMLLNFFKSAPTTRPWFLAMHVTPTSGSSAGGTALTIDGANFQTGATVTIGGVAASNVTVVGPREIDATAPALAPGTLNDIVVTNPDATTSTLAQGFLADFLDVPQSHAFHSYVEPIFRAGITAGCGNGNDCPDDSVTRAQMAVFLLKGKHGSSYQPAACTGLFQDVPCPGGFAVDWIEQLYNEGITAGCSVNPLMYCPTDPVTRAQMAVFLLGTEHGSGYVPPSAIGIFGDVPPGSFAADWIEELYNEEITGGCSASPPLYCPDDANTRGQMAVFLVTTFGL